MKTTTLATILIGTLLTTGCTEKSEQELLKEAQVASQSGDTKQAEILIKQAIAQKPSDSLRLQLASIYIKHGEIIGAAKELERLNMKVISSSEAEEAERINAHISLLNFDPEYTPLSSTKPDCTVCELVTMWADLSRADTTSVNNTGLNFSSIKAIELFRSKQLTSADATSLIDNIKFEEELLIIADLMRRSNQPQGAIQAYSAYKAKFPSTINIYLPYAQALVALGEYQQAEALVDTTLAKFEKNPVANYLKSLVLLSEERYSDALNYVSLADTYGMNSASASLTKGTLEFNEEKYESALSSFQKAVSLSPNNELANAMLIATQVKLGIGDDALAKLASADSYSPIELASIGQLIGKNKDAPEWQQIQNKLDIQSSPTGKILFGLIDLAKKGESDILGKPGDENDEGYNLIQVSMLLNQAKFDEALEYVNKWLARTNEKAVVLNYKGAIQVANNDRAGADKTFKEALLLNPNNRASRMFFAQSHALNTDYESALDELNLILEYNVVDLATLKLFMAFEQLVDNESYRDIFIQHLDNAIEGAEQKIGFQLLKAGYLAVTASYPLAQNALSNVDSERAESINQYWEILFFIATEQRKLREAEDVYNNWKRTFPSSLRPIHAMATYYETVGLTKKAIEVLERSPLAVMNPNDRIATNAKLALLYITAGDLTKAEYTLAKLRVNEFTPKSALSYVEGFLAFRKGDLKNSARHLEIAYEAGRSHHVLRLLYVVNVKLGKDSRKLLERHVAQYPNDRASKALFAESLIGKDNSAAITLFTSLIDTDMSDGDVYNNLAWAYYLEKNYDLALSFSTKALDLKSDNDEYVDTMLRVLTKLERFDDVISYKDKASSQKTKLFVANALIVTGDEQAGKALLNKITPSSLAKEDRALFDAIN
ncbi:tetratricopeptide repeat protein [Alteromonas sp. A079]|uniref:tetratricopeptide repeat protein n=1 Tax=Alteromonas sp. A079 TaxID=3410268 RepID=UPI003B9DF51F